MRAASRTSIGHLRPGDARAVLPDVVGVVLAELLADRVELATQEHLALLPVEPFGDLGTDLLAQLRVGERLTRPADHELEAGLDVDRLEQLDALVLGEVGPVSRAVGEGTRLVDALDHADHAAQAALLEELLHERPVLLRELAGARAGSALVERLDRNVQRATRSGAPHTHASPGEPADHERLEPVSELAGVLDPRNGADPRVAAVGTGNQHQTPVAVAGGLGRSPGLVGLERDRDDHLREHGAVGEREDGKRESLGLGHQTPSRGVGVLQLNLFVSM